MHRLPVCNNVVSLDAPKTFRLLSVVRLRAAASSGDAEHDG